MTAHQPIPDFPATVGEEGAIEFEKDSRRFRITRINDDQLVIHQAGKTEAQFVVYLHSFTRDGLVFDAEGITDTGSMSGLGTNRGMLARLF
jgi:hypothetical protein